MDYVAPISEVRGKLPELLHKLAQFHKRLIITKNGRAEAVMMTPEDFETLEIKADKELVRSILRGQEDIKSGRLYSHSDIFKNV